MTERGTGETYTFSCPLHGIMQSESPFAWSDHQDHQPPPPMRMPTPRPDNHQRIVMLEAEMEEMRDRIYRLESHLGMWHD